MARGDSIREEGPDDVEHVRSMAERLGFLIEDDFQLLAGVTESTTEAWRKRGIGPPYVRMGNRYFYPLSGLKKHLEDSAQKRGQPVDLL